MGCEPRLWICCYRDLLVRPLVKYVQNGLRARVQEIYWFTSLHKADECHLRKSTCHSMCFCQFIFVGHRHRVCCRLLVPLLAHLLYLASRLEMKESREV